MWQFRAGEGIDISVVEETFRAELALPDVRASIDPGTNTFFTRTPAINEADHQKFLAILKGKFSGFEELGFQSIGPSVGAELRNNAIWAIALVLVGISLYIAFAFRKASKPVSSWKYGWVALITLLHDVAIPAGMLALLGYFMHVEIDTNFIVALLVVMGFSVHDTIVVFDRVRENLLLSRVKLNFEKTVNDSVNQTMARSINTSLTLILVLIALLFAGPEGLRYFILTLLVGTSVGVYSSIFVASPLLVVFGGKQIK
ncbi:MAG: protein translocase subunit SecF [Patescibacteria group bacterium]